MMIDETPIQRLSHDIKTLAAILMDAAERLRTLPAAEQQSLVADMVEPAQRLADKIRRYRDGAPR